MSTAALPDLFRSLADPTRLRLLHALTVGEFTVGELAELLGSAQSGVSRHLAVLKQSGMVADRREGASSFYSVPFQPMDERARAIWPMVRSWLDQHPESKGDRTRLEAIRARRRSREYFQEVAPRFDSLRAAQYGEEMRHLALLELVPDELVVLDVGTGTGFMSMGIAPRVAKVIAVDASMAMLEQARANLEAAGIRNVELRQGDLDALPVPDASVDAVLANMVLHHAEDPAAAVAEMARTLKPDGRLIVTDLARHPHEWTKDELADRWQGFEAAELSRWMEDARLERGSVRPVGTCTLARSRGREKHAVEVLLATARKNRSDRSSSTSTSASTTTRRSPNARPSRISRGKR